MSEIFPVEMDPIPFILPPVEMDHDISNRYMAEQRRQFEENFPNRCSPRRIGKRSLAKIHLMFQLTFKELISGKKYRTEENLDWISFNEMHLCCIMAFFSFHILPKDSSAC